MKNLYKTLGAGILVSAFFMFNTAIAVEDRQPQKECAAETQEIVLKEAIEKSPELLKTMIEGPALDLFFQRMQEQKMLLGSVGVDKIYIFYSEHHPTWVYLFFLNHECILDVKFTFKNLIDYFITGDESLIKRDRR